jgi:hypothetical protein
MTSIVPLMQVTHKLAEAGIGYALGGSGLLYSLGLVEAVRDWDLTTEAPMEEIKAALRGLHIEESPSGDDPFASRYRLSVHREAPQIDLIGGFAIRTDAGTCRLPVVHAFDWQGIRAGSPEVWFIAYSLMNRKEKAALLLDFLRRNGADPALVRRLGGEPLPDPLRDELFSLLT